MRDSDSNELTSAEAAAELAHRVGKYVSRTARNLPEGDIPSAVVELFIEDVFQTDGSRPALEVFEELAASPSLLGSPRLDRCRDLLKRIARMEPEIRKGEGDTVRSAAAMTLEVDSELRALAGEIQRMGK